MAINAREAPGGGVKQDPMDPGSYPSRVVQIIDFGLQPQQFNGEAKPPARELGVTYEHLDEFLKDEDGNDIEDKPRWTSETFALHNLGSERAKSTQRYYALDPKEEFEGDWSKLLNKPCIVTVVNKAGTGKNKGKVYNNVATISAMRPREADKAAPLKNKPKFFDLEVITEENAQLFYSFPDWIQKKIRAGLEFDGSEFAELLERVKPNKDTKKEEKRGEVEDSIPHEGTDEGDGNW